MTGNDVLVIAERWKCVLSWTCRPASNSTNLSFSWLYSNRTEPSTLHALWNS